jgi:polyribonucleotide nucleotidyltransferase
MNKYVKKEITFAGKKLVLETGELAMQANTAVKATYGDTVVLVAAVAGAPNPDIDFFPLTVVYEEKLYASGSIKSSRFVKRDGRPTDDAVITKRLVDHAIRPLFPSDYMDEVQVAITVLSLDETSDPEFLSLIATSACLSASNIPWNGPMVSARVSFANGDYTLNPSREQLEEADLNMMASFVGEDRKFLAVEADANILPEEKILGGLEFAWAGLEEVVPFINDFAKEVNEDAAKYTYLSKALDSTMLEEVTAIVKPRVQEMLSAGFDKTKLKEHQDASLAELFTTLEGKYKKADMSRAFAEVEKKSLQNLILDEGKRPDGRKIDEIRPIESKVGFLPRTHGSALFTRGITQVMTVATLGSPSLEMLIQDMYGEKSKRYIHFYNFPPYSVGETGRFGGPSSRDIGHGMLAEKALAPVIPNQKDFPYTILLTSETLSSSGSSSMAATCGSTLALMDAGVPIKDMVAGIGVGLIVNDDMSKQLVMSDLAYMEDAFGFMDFKMTGTKDGVTAIQCDMKLAGVPMSLLPKIIEQSREGRMFVLEEMRKTLTEPKTAVSQYAPKMLCTKIDPDKIGMVIGSGGKTIKEIQEKYEVEISIDDDGSVVVSSVNIENAEQALATVEGIVKDVEIGEIYEGLVEDIADFGAFVEILPGKTGLAHISELSHEYVSNINDVVKIGDTLKVKVIDKGPNGKISLSVKALTERPAGMPEERSDFNRGPSRPGRSGGRSSDRDNRRRPNRDRY